MARRALEAKAMVVFYDGVVPEEAPISQMDGLYGGGQELSGGGFFHPAEESYRTRWEEVVANIPITAKCLGGTGAE